jgi:glucose-1-phosphate adenylyltransferase
MKTNSMCAVLGNISRFEGLWPLTENRPLDTLPFDCKYRLIDFPLSSIANANIHSLFMVFNEGETRSVFDHIGGGKEWNLDSVQNRYFVYFYQDFLKQRAQGLPFFASMIDYLEKAESEYTVFLGSNRLCTIDLKQVLKKHKQKQNKLTVVYKKMPRNKISLDASVVKLNQSDEALSVNHLEEEVQEEELVNLCMDMYIVQTDWLIKQLEQNQNNDSSPSIYTFLQHKISEEKATAYEYTGYLSDIYDVESYFQANMDMLDPEKFRALLYSNKKVYTKLKNEVPTYYSKESKVKNSQCATGCIIEGSLENCLVSRRAVIKKGAEIKRSIIMANATILEDVQIEYAILDKNVTIEAGVKISGTKEHPVIVQKNQVVTSDILGGENG